MGLPWLKQYNPKINWEKGTLDLDASQIKPTFNEILTQQHENERAEVPEIPLEEIEPTLLNAIVEGRSSINIKEEQNDLEIDLLHMHLNNKTVTDELQAYSDLSLTAEEPVWIQVKTSISQQLQHDADKETDKPKVKLPERYNEFQSVFDKATSERLPEHKSWDHAIDLKPDFVPRDCKVYPLTLEEQNKLDEFLEENLRKGYIRPSKSPMASPFFFISKKDSSNLRSIQDYRRLNEGTIKNRYPLPLVSDLLDKLKGAKYFTKLDMRWGYNNVRIKKGDEWKTAFKTNRGLFECLVAFFGLCNMPSTFQAMMDEIFIEELNDGWLLSYIDDILIFSKTLEEDTARTRQVLQKLKKNDLYLNLEKCAFGVTQCDYLGLIIRENEIAMDPTKLEGIAKWPTPTTVKQVRSFLGFGNFYRRFIGHYADLARPLNDLTKKDQKWEWTERHQKSFDQLKAEFMKSPVLQMPDQTKPFIIEADASKWATGAVLRQQDINGNWHPCGYISHSFDATERNYEIYDRELFSIIRALETWRHYLLGSPFPTVILSDHKNLTYWKEAQKLNRRQARWYLHLSEFDLKLVHTPGTRMIQSDALSRRPDHIPAEDNDNEDIIILPDNIFIKMIDTELQDTIVRETLKDNFFTSALLALKESGTPPIKSDLADWKLEDGILFFRDKCYVPPTEDLRREITRRYHNSPSSGHPGHLKTLELIRRHYWWPGMTVFVKNYVSGCAICQQMKVNTHPTNPGLMPIKAQEDARPFSQITMDFITDLPANQGYDSLMVVVDHGSTKGVISIPCTKTIDAAGTAKLYIENVFRRFGLPDSMLSDRGPQFASQVFREIGRLLGIKLIMSTAYHPQTDGETERVNQELEIYFRIFCSNNPETWVNLNPIAEFCHNQRVHSTTKQSPFFLMLGYAPRDIPLAFPQSNVPAADRRLKELQEARNEALAAHELARQRVIERSLRNFTPFKLGEKVWLDGKNLKIGYPTRKFAPKREGPFKITEVMGPVTYRLKLPPKWKIHPVFHATLLTPFKETTTHGPNFLQPPPDLIKGEEHYEVEAIVGHKIIRNIRHFRVKWFGYSGSSNTWEPEENLKDAMELLEDYKQRKHLS